MLRSPCISPRLWFSIRIPFLISTVLLNLSSVAPLGLFDLKPESSAAIASPVSLAVRQEIDGPQAEQLECIPCGRSPG